MEGGKAPVINGRRLKSLQYLSITPRADRMCVEVDTHWMEVSSWLQDPI
jgi:hypothetical protein